MSVRFEIDRSEVDELERTAPEAVNKEMNRGFNRIAAGFFERLLPRLMGAGITVRRAVATGKGGSKVVPAEARAMGFRARLRGASDISGKTMTIFNRSPVMKAHEHGAVIRPKKGPFLYLKDRSGVPMGDLQRSNKVGRIFAKVRSVTIKPRLGFYSTWDGYVSEVPRHMEEVARNVEKRLERQAKKAAKADLKVARAATGGTQTLVGRGRRR